MESLPFLYMKEPSLELGMSDPQSQGGPLLPTQVLCGWGGGLEWQLPRDCPRSAGIA